MAHKWNQQNRFVLLEEYAKHRKEFLCNGVKEDKIWKEIADEVRRKCFLDCSALDCCDEIERMRLRYEINKNRPVTKTKVALFQYHAKCAFEMEENSEGGDKEKQVIKEEKIDSPSEVCSVTSTVPDSSVTTTEPAAPISHSTTTIISTDSSTSNCKDFKLTVPTAEISSNVPSYECNKWIRKKTIRLLQVYKKHLRELTNPNIEKQSVWKKIAVEVMADSSKFFCDGPECCEKIEQLRIEYEKSEYKHITDRTIAIRSDIPEIVFETAKNLVNFPAQQQSFRKLKDCGKTNKNYRLNLLQVYAKFKTKLSPDVEELCVWKEVAREMREAFFYNCGKFLCRFDLLKLHCQYHQLKNSVKHIPYFFYEAKNAFETTYKPDSKQIKVENCSNESTFPNSNKRKHEEELNSSTSNKKIDTERIL